MRGTLAIALSVAAIAVGASIGLGEEAAVEEAAAAPAAVAKRGGGSLKRAVRKLSAKQLAGQRVIVSFDGAEPSPRLFKMIRRGLIAGVIFFGANTGFEPPSFDTRRDRVRELIARMQRARREAKPKVLRRPLLIMTDQEGGLVRRLGGQPSNSERTIGKSDDGVQLAREAGFGAANNLAGVGMNVNLAPVLGVIESGDGFLGQYMRAYGFNRKKVSRLGKRFIRAHQERGIATTAKHFPGLGAATKAQNTDEVPVTLRIPLRKLRNIDEYPYHAAIAEGTDLVMISNARYPALDRRWPASMSPRIVKRELRDRLGFRGVTITDAIEAGGLEPIGNIPQRARQGARAGVDLLLFSKQTLHEGVTGLKALRRALRNGRLNRRGFERSARRTLRLRKTLPAKAIEG